MRKLKYCHIVIALLLLPYLGMSQSANKMDLPSIPKLFVIKPEQLDSIYHDSSFIHAPLIQRIHYFSEAAIGTPYKLYVLGEGPNSDYDKDPLIDLTQADCVTFVEQTLALAISNNYDDLLPTLLKIRYKNSEVHLKTRNHFIFADWLPNNSWIVEDVTKEIGGNLCKPLTRISNRHWLLRKMGCQDTSNVIEATTVTFNYVPKQNLNKVLDKIHSGDIAALISGDPDIDVFHMGFIIKKNNGEIVFRNAQKWAKQVMDEPIETQIQRQLKFKNRVGMAFFRVKSNITLN
jgi:hypothetical protein